MSSPQTSERHDEMAAAAGVCVPDPAVDASSLGARELQDDLMRRISAAATTATAIGDAQADRDAVDAPEEGRQDNAFLSTVPASAGAWRLATAVVVVSGVIFLAAIPFVRMPLPNVPAFIPAYQSALAINDLITAILLFGLYNRLRAWALLPLASGYLFSALLIVCHTLTFPGVFTPTGLLGAGSQSTAWLYVFWHGGFPLSVLAYAVLRRRGGTDLTPPERTAPAIMAAIAICIAAAAALTTLATAGMSWLPVIIEGSDYSLLVSKGISPTLWVLSLVALIALWRLRRTTVLDLWLMVVMCVWLCDVGLSAVFGSARYDLGWYAGRTYGLMAASFVLGILLLETNGLHARLATAKAQLADRARDLGRRVRERTLELQRSNDALKVEIAERQLAEQELLRTRAFLDTVVESIPAMVMVKDANSRELVLLNRAGEELLGCDRSEVIGKTASHWMAPGEADIVDALDTRVLVSNKPFETQEHDLTTRARGSRRLRTKKVRVPDETGQAKYVLGFSEDITEQRQTEEQLKHAQKMEALGQLTGGLAHDFNNLLAIIIGNLDVLHDMGKREPQQEELTQAALEAALRGGELIRRLLAFARRQPLQPDEIDVNELIGDIGKLLARTLGESVVLELDLDPKLPRVVADPAQLETAIANLANNARDAMPKGGRLVIATGRTHLDCDYTSPHAEMEPGDYLTIEVTDTGEGMTPEVRERIFEPFFTTKGPGKGTGLGLSMVFGFIKQSGGHINVYSEPGRGTTFRLYFRMAAPSTGEDGGKKADLLERGDKGEGETILVVEDNPNLLRIVVKQLTDLGYRVLAADTARKALEVLDSGQPVDLLFTDVVMPGGMDGCELARTTLARRPGVKVLLTSGFPGTSLTDVEGLGGGIRLLSKPYRKEELTRTVRSVLDAAMGSAMGSDP